MENDTEKVTEEEIAEIESNIRRASDIIGRLSEGQSEYVKDTVIKMIVEAADGSLESMSDKWHRKMLSRWIRGRERAAEESQAAYDDLEDKTTVYARVCEGQAKADLSASCTFRVFISESVTGESAAN